MSTAYDPALTRDVDRARLLLGDVGKLKDAEGATIWLLQDETISALVARYGFDEGLAQCCDALIAEYSQDPSKLTDEAGTSTEWANRLSGWDRLARQRRSAPTDKAASGGYVSAPSTGAGDPRLW